MARHLEKLALDTECPIGCLSPTAFWILFAILGILLGAIGHLFYTSF
jgi:hypothetical protein